MERKVSLFILFKWLGIFYHSVRQTFSTYQCIIYLLPNFMFILQGHILSNRKKFIPYNTNFNLKRQFPEGDFFSIFQIFVAIFLLSQNFSILPLDLSSFHTLQGCETNCFSFSKTWNYLVAYNVNSIFFMFKFVCYVLILNRFDISLPKGVAKDFDMGLTIKLD